MNGTPIGCMPFIIMGTGRGTRNGCMPGIIKGMPGIIGSMPGMAMFIIGAGRGRRTFLLFMAVRVSPDLSDEFNEGVSVQDFTTL